MRSTRIHPNSNFSAVFAQNYMLADISCQTLKTKSLDALSGHHLKRTGLSRDIDGLHAANSIWPGPLGAYDL